MVLRSRAARTVVAVALAVAAFLAVVTPAAALVNPKVTLDQEIGGVPTRFTFVTVTDPDGRIPSLDLVFPKDFDLSKVTFDAVTLEGLKRVLVTVKGQPTGETLNLSLDPAIAPNSTLRIQVYNVVPPNAGGTYGLKVDYSVESTSTGSSTASGTPTVARRTDDTMKFSYATAPFSEMLSRSLDQQAWVTQFNSVKALGMFFKPQLIVQSIPLMFMGWVYAVGLVLAAFPIAISGGLGLAFMKMSKIPPVRWIAAAYVNVIRGTPLFLQIFVAFIGLRIAGLRVDDYVTAIAVLAINSSAYLAEIFRAGIQSISKGQFEASSSLGMTYRQSMQFVIIPQTVKRVLPTMTSEFILLFKDTALLAAVGIPELMFAAQNKVAITGNMTPFVVSAVYYLILTIPLINLVGRLEARLALSEHGQSAPGRRRRRGVLEGLARTADPPAAEPGAVPTDKDGR